MSKFEWAKISSLEEGIYPDTNPTQMFPEGIAWMHKATAMLKLNDGRWIIEEERDQSYWFRYAEPTEVAYVQLTGEFPNE